MIPPPQSSRPISTKRRARLLMLFVLLFILYLVGRYFGIAERFDPEALRIVVGETGWLGVLIYLGSAQTWLLSFLSLLYAVLMVQVLNLKI